jgi:hypothetical protein
MARKVAKPPAYSLHRASGQAAVRIHGRDHYLGRKPNELRAESEERLTVRTLRTLFLRFVFLTSRSAN